MIQRNSQGRFTIGVVCGYIIVGLTSLTAWADPPAIPGWDVTWFDEFDGNSLDNSLWTPIFSTAPTNNSRHAYLPGQVSVAGGNMVIRSENIPFGGLPYRSGQVISKNAQHYGRWEVRGRLPTSQGMWPAIWLLPDVAQYPWPSQGEIDIMENRGTQPHLTSSAFHWGTNPPFSHQFVYDEQQQFVAGQPANYHDSFHTYAVEWSADQLRFYVDDVHHYTVYDEDTGGFLSSQSAPMETVINTAVGGTFLDDPDATTVWPQDFLIDYVHVYQRNADPLQLTFDNGGFDAIGGSIRDWSTFGNRIPNVLASTAEARSGSGSLKLFGQFNNSAFSGVEQGIDVVAGEELRAFAASLIQSGDSLAGTDNRAFLKIDYYRTQYGRFGTSDYISSDEIRIADSSSAEDNWLTHELRSTVPVGAVEARVAVVFEQPSNNSGAVFVDDVLFGRRGDYTFVWDGLGDGNWNEAGRWVGPALDMPTDFDRAEIRNNQVTVLGTQAAFATRVTQQGRLNVIGTLVSDVQVEVEGQLSGVGMVDGNVMLAGQFIMDAAFGHLEVLGDLTLESAELSVAEQLVLPPGAVVEDILLLVAADVSGAFSNSTGPGSASHLGEGNFLLGMYYTATEVRADVYAALPGDADGDGVVDGADFLIWNDHKFESGTDWLSGDFNGDGVTDGADFLIWNDHKFTSVSLPTAVPEPTYCVLTWLVCGVFASRWRRVCSRQEKLRSL